MNGSKNVETKVFDSTRSDYDRVDDPALLRQIGEAQVIHLFTVEGQPTSVVSFSTYGDPAYTLVTATSFSDEACILSYIATLGFQIQPVLAQREGFGTLDYFCQKPPAPTGHPQRWDSRVTGPL